MTTATKKTELPPRVNIASTHPFNFFRQLKEKFFLGYEVCEASHLILTPSFLALEMVLPEGDLQ